MSQAPLPETDWDLTRPFWQAAKESEFVMPRCADCERYVWYPEEQCPHCGAGDVLWVQVEGRGLLFSWAEVRHPLHPPYKNQLPYITGIVALEVDPRVHYVTRIVECTTSELAIEMPMEVVYSELSFHEVEGAVIAPVFRPVARKPG